MTIYSRLPQANRRDSIASNGEQYAEAAAQARACRGDLPLLRDFAKGARTPARFLSGRPDPLVPPGNGALFEPSFTTAATRLSRGATSSRNRLPSHAADWAPPGSAQKTAPWGPDQPSLRPQLQN